MSQVREEVKGEGRERESESEKEYESEREMKGREANSREELHEVADDVTRLCEDDMFDILPTERRGDGRVKIQIDRFRVYG